MVVWRSLLSFKIKIKFYTSSEAMTYIGDFQFSLTSLATVGAEKKMWELTITAVN